MIRLKNRVRENLVIHSIAFILTVLVMILSPITIYLKVLLKGDNYKYFIALYIPIFFILFYLAYIKIFKNDKNKLKVVNVIKASIIGHVISCFSLIFKPLFISFYDLMLSIKHLFSLNQLFWKLIVSPFLSFGWFFGIVYLLNIYAIFKNRKLIFWTYISIVIIWIFFHHQIFY